MESKTDNEIIAEFDGLVFEIESGKWCRQIESLPTGCWAYGRIPNDLGYNKSYDDLMPIWFKFRNIRPTNLNDQIAHARICKKIAYRITNNEIWVACKYLADGIKWYNDHEK